MSDREQGVTEFLAFVALISGVALVAYLEWHAARVAVGPWPAIFLPLLIDSYVIMAIMSGRGVRSALFIMGMSVMVGVGVSVSQTYYGEVNPLPVMAWLAVTVPVVLGKVHQITHQPDPLPVIESEPMIDGAIPSLFQPPPPSRAQLSPAANTRPIVIKPDPVVPSSRQQRLDVLRQQLPQHPDRSVGEWAKEHGVSRAQMSKDLAQVRGS